MLRARSSLIGAFMPARRCLVAAITLILVAFIPVAPAHAYCASPALKWNTNTLHVNTSALIPSGWAEALSAAASQWNGVAGANWTLSYHKYSNANTSGDHVYLYRFGDAPPPAAP